MASFARRIYTWRVVYCMSQQRAADVAGVSLKQWQRWERGEAAPNERNGWTVLRLTESPPPGWTHDVAEVLE